MKVRTGHYYILKSGARDGLFSFETLLHMQRLPGHHLDRTQWFRVVPLMPPGPNGAPWAPVSERWIRENFVEYNP